MHISEAVELETPLGNLRVDQRVCSDLMATGIFETMSAQVGEIFNCFESVVSLPGFIMFS